MDQSDSERVHEMVAYFQAHNFAISNQTSDTKDGITIHSFQFKSPDGLTTSSMRVAFARGQIYRVIATAGKDEKVPSEFEPFLASFKVHS